MSIKVYGGWSNNLDIRKKSSSGGVFSELAKYIIGIGGTVYGAALFTTDGVVSCRHIRCKSIEDLSLLRGAKYILSDVGELYSEIKIKLKNNEWVLFSGTPCQVGALYSFLGKDYPTLFTIDLICHGIPAPKLSEMMWNNLETVSGSKIRNIEFRNKDIGWEDYSFRVDFENGREYSEIGMNSVYMRLFFSDMFLRESCYNCGFKGDNHCSDLTLGDFWGIKKYHQVSDYDLKNGISVILSYTDKGEKLLEKMSTVCTLFESTYHVFNTGNRYLKRKADKPFDIWMFRKKLSSQSPEILITKINKNKRLRELINRVKNKLVIPDKNSLKKLENGLPAKKNCYSCAVCKLSCPVSAITMTKDYNGFEYPRIDNEKCIHCHLCEKVCPSLMTFTKGK